MFEIFKGDQEEQMDVKASRDAALRFIKEELQRLEGGEGKNIRGLQLFVASSDDKRHIYEAALYVEAPERLKDEVQKIADDFDIELPGNWNMEVEFIDVLPPQVKKAPDLEIGLFVKTRQNLIQKELKACIRILNGEAEKEDYILNSGSDKINIGRERSAQGPDGFIRINNIAFPGDSTNEANKYISRQHAHIAWNTENGHFMIFADEGGVPPQNKIKIKSLNDDAVVKLNSTQIGHVLREGDQIILGESAVIEFRSVAKETEL